MLHILVSNRFESLQDSLLANLEKTPASPFAPEQIIIPNAAIQRSLTLGITNRFGICSNVQFSFLAQWLWRQIGQVLPEVALASPFAAPVLTWRVFGVFQDASFISVHPRLQHYLQQATPLMTYQLAVRTATHLEQYLTYRPDWLAAWSAGKTVTIVTNDQSTGFSAEDQAWQAALWRRISTDLGTDREHPAAQFLRTVAAMGPEAGKRVGLPEVAHVFCLPTIPPLYLDLLRKLGRWIDLRLYLLNPCQEYWFDIVDRRRLGYLAARNESPLQDHHEVGNRLLAGWGKQTQALMDLVLNSEGDEAIADGEFYANTSGSLLAEVQNAVLDLEEIVPGQFVAIGALGGDRSVEVHVCHSMTRELEVLHDQLLAMFAGTPSLSPADVLVVTPDLKAAAPLIDAVFGNAQGARHIPFAVTGRARSSLNIPARTLMLLLELLSSRFAASAVFHLLQQPVIARRFGFGEDELVRIRDWITDAGIRWGTDAAHRASLDLPAQDRYSFSDGMSRLFLGYALPDQVDLPWEERLPAGAAEGSETATLGSFSDLLERLAGLQIEFSRPKSSASWHAALLDVLDTLFEPAAEELEDFRELRASLAELRDTMERGGVSDVVPLEVVRAALEALLDDPARGGVPTGSVTFSSMSSLRGLPYRVICVIGLNDGAFPTRVAPSEFDLLALSYRRGDRQRRLDERTLFLDLLLAARERFYLSYTGRSIRDNALLPPSVLIAELLDWLVPALAAETDPAQLALARSCLVVEHPLQAFSTSCFDVSSDVRLRSFRRDYCDAVRASLQPQMVTDAATDHEFSADVDDDQVQDDSSSATEPCFFPAPLSAPGSEWHELSLESLIRFFRHPCRYLLRERVQLTLIAADESLADDEPFLPDFHGCQAMAERLLPQLMCGIRGDALRSYALAGLEYPVGALGQASLDRELVQLAGFADELARATQVPCLPPHHVVLDFELESAGQSELWRISSAMNALRSGGMVRHRYDDTRAVDYLEGWLGHLFMCAAADEATVMETLWISRDGSFRLHPCADARKILHELLGLYRQGLSEPLHFFPKSAWSYIAAEQSMSKARASWLSTRDRPWGEDKDAYYRLALRGVANPLDAGFERCAQLVFGSMMSCLEDARL